MKKEFFGMKKEFFGMKKELIEFLFFIIKKRNFNFPLKRR